MKVLSTGLGLYLLKRGFCVNEDMDDDDRVSDDEGDDGGGGGGGKL